MAIVGVGIDVVDVTRFEAALRRTPDVSARLFVAAEASRPVASLAARFAAKEALAKAMGAPSGLSWQDFEVVHDEQGAPRFALHGAAPERVAALGVETIHLSISHDTIVATAFVVAEC